MKIFEFQYIGIQNQNLVTVFHVDDRMSQTEMEQVFAKLTLPFSCLKVNVGYLNDDDILNHKLSVKTIYNCQGYHIIAMMFPIEYLNLPFYRKSFRLGFFAIDETIKHRNLVVYYEVKDLEWVDVDSKEVCKETRVYEKYSLN